MDGRKNGAAKPVTVSSYLRNSIRVRVLLCILGSLLAGTALALLSDWLLEGIKWLPFNPGARLGLVLLLLLLFSVMVIMSLISTMLSPITTLSRRLSRIRTREEIQRLNPDEFAEMAPLIRTIIALIDWAENQQHLAAAIRSASLQRIEKLAEVDALTGLYNRHYLTSILSVQIKNAQSLSDHLSVIMLDVDHFKHYNDTNGHPEGDKVLARVAEILQRGTRQHDICCRYGGEEFLIVLPTANLERARMIAERIRLAIEQDDFPHGERQPLGRLTASFGVASYPLHSTEANTLIKHADQALYLAKQQGRNRVHTYDDVHAAEIDEPKARNGGKPRAPQPTV